jgi:hypothetical protein
MRRFLGYKVSGLEWLPWLVFVFDNQRFNPSWELSSSSFMRFPGQAADVLTTTIIGGPTTLWADNGRGKFIFTIINITAIIMAAACLAWHIRQFKRRPKKFIRPQPKS